MTHTVELSSFDYFSGTVWCDDPGRDVRGWLRENVGNRWQMGVFEVRFADAQDAMLFKLWMGD